jgi:hypothetical protein
MKEVLNWAAALAGFAAAWFWYKSASTRIPDPPAGAFAEAVVPALIAYREAAQKAARANQRAALLSAFAALLTGAGLLVP